MVLKRGFSVHVLQLYTQTDNLILIIKCFVIITVVYYSNAIIHAYFLMLLTVFFSIFINDVCYYSRIYGIFVYNTYGVVDIQSLLKCVINVSSVPLSL